MVLSAGALGRAAVRADVTAAPGDFAVGTSTPAAAAVDSSTPAVPVAAVAPPAVPPPAEQGSAFLVNDPVVDLRRDAHPLSDNAALKQPYDMDSYQETQLLYQEEVRAGEEKGDWVSVNAVGQPEFTHHKSWEGYPGWVRKRNLVPKPQGFSPNAVVTSLYAKMYDQPGKGERFMEVPLGARLDAEYKRRESWTRILRPGMNDGWVRTRDLRAMSDMPKGEDAVRRSVIETAKMFLNQPYYWGGISSHRDDNTDMATGVDCSGLVFLAYRASGIDVPRDSHEQYLRSRPILFNEIKPGDLIFLARTSNPNQIVHVMMYLGNDRVIEAVYEFNVVHLTTVERKLGKPLSEILPLEAVAERFVYLGRLVPEQESISAVKIPDVPSEWPR